MSPHPEIKTFKDPLGLDSPPAVGVPVRAREAFTCATLSGLSWIFSRCRRELLCSSPWKGAFWLRSLLVLFSAGLITQLKCGTFQIYYFALMSVKALQVGRIQNS